ncbi:MAG: PhoH family protein, partial [Xanthomonadaceae bacterium]|nr:PhoH family protein [Xanthomonadaceae bacterium]
MSELNQRDFTLDPQDNTRLANLCGPFDEHLRQIELRLGVEINHRGHLFQVIGGDVATRATDKVLRTLYQAAATEALTGAKVNLHLAESGIDAIGDASIEGTQEVVIRVKRGVIKGRGPNQARYLHAIASHDISFGVGPAGTGKTYLAVAMAVSALLTKQVNRIILARPAVEAGERLGFLPGTLQEKVNPYLRPLYDALYDVLDPDRVERYLEKS